MPFRCLKPAFWRAGAAGGGKEGNSWGAKTTDGDFGWRDIVLIAARSFDMIAYTEWV